MANDIPVGSLNWTFQNTKMASYNADDAGITLGNQVDDLEELLMKSYSMSDTSGTTGSNFLSEIKTVTGKTIDSKVGIDGIRNFLTSRLQRAVVAMQAFSQTMKDKFQGALEILRNARTS